MRRLLQSLRRMATDGTWKYNKLQKSKQDIVTKCALGAGLAFALMALSCVELKVFQELIQLLYALFSIGYIQRGIRFESSSCKSIRNVEYE
jgi:uncharacterized protein (DUF486 family)